MKLEVGQFVRTDKGLLGKLISKEKDGCGFILKYEGQYGKTVWSSLGTDSEIIKASHNIIDLIEVGDYVNGYEVTSKDQFLGFGNHDWYMANDEIKSIVTREQFSAMEYKVESEVK